MNWLHAQLTEQLESVDKGNTPDGVKRDNRIDVQPTMFGYSVQLDESDLIYNLTHEEVLGDHFDPKWVIDRILAAPSAKPTATDHAGHTPVVAHSKT